MPERPGPVLIVNVTAILDRSKAGQAGAQALEARFKTAREKRAQMKDPVEGAKFEIDAVREIEAERGRLREELLAKARVVAEAVRKEKGAALVVDRAIALAFDQALDVTDEVLVRLDKA